MRASPLTSSSPPAQVPPTPLTASSRAGQFVHAGDIAALTVFLCSDTAGQITGASLPVDGGWTAQ